MTKIDNSDDPIIGEITKAYAEIDMLHGQVRAKKREIVLLAVSLSRVPDRRRRLSLAHKLYWEYDVPGWAIAAGLLFDNALASDDPAELDRLEHAVKSSASQNAMRRMIGPAWQIACQTANCPGVHLIQSRSALAAVHRDSRVYRNPYRCPDCEKAYRTSHTVSAEELAAREAKYRVERMKRKEEFEALRGKMNLSQEELIRLYQLMSALEWERGQS